MNEAHLEAAIAEQPGLLGIGDPARDDIRAPFAVFRQRSLRAPGGRTIYPDLLVLCGSGHVLVVEVKLADNTDLRNRDVIGQILEYKASLARCTQLELLTVFDGPARGAAQWAELVAQLFPAADTGLANTFLRNLRTGNLQLFIACDGVSDGLVELVEGLVEGDPIGAFALSVVEISLFASPTGESQVLLPHARLDSQIVARTLVEVTYKAGESEPGVKVQVMSADDAARAVEGARRRSAGRAWDESSFFVELTGCADSATAEALRWIYDEAISRGYGIRWGSGAKTGTLYLIHPKLNRAVIGFDSSGTAWGQFGGLEEPVRTRLREALAALPGVVFSDTAWPAIKSEMWRPHREAILNVLDTTCSTPPPGVTSAD
jgi:hypothetical protein